jgi:hypothetical protein
MCSKDDAFKRSTFQWGTKPAEVLIGIAGKLFNDFDACVLTLGRSWGLGNWAGEKSV